MKLRLKPLPISPTADFLRFEIVLSIRIMQAGKHPVILAKILGNAIPFK
jgi:hypothetical protein